jgi:DNA-binding beta-propeller fold protein YncE
MARNHHVVDLKLKTSYSALLKKSSLFCEQHKDCDVEYFCVDHDELCCRDCLAKTHKSCVNTMSLDSASKGAKQSQLFSECQEHLTSISQTYKNILKYREENVNGIKDDKEKIKENMKKLKEKLIQRINQIEKELTNKLEILVQENTKFQLDEISKVLEVTEEVELYLKEMLFIIEHGSEKQAFLLCRIIDKYLHQADKDLQTTTSQLKRVTLSFDESNDLLPAINAFGDVTVNKIIDHTITHKTLKDQQAQFVSDKTTTISTFKLQNHIEDTGRAITGMVVTDDDHLLLCDCSSEDSKLVTVYYPSGKYMKTIDVSDPPWDIAIIPSTRRAVVTFGNNKIQFINLQTFTQDDKLITIPNYAAICGITSTSDNIIVGDEGRIHCLDTEGTYLRTITLSPEYDAHYLSIGHNNHIYYTSKSSVHCVNWDETEVFSYKIPNEDDHRKIAIDRNGNVYVVGSDTNTIQRLHSNGTVDCVVLNEGDGVNRPLSICFNKSCDKLYMANYESSVVHVYACS